MTNGNGDANGGISVPGWLWKLFLASVALSLGIWWTSYVFTRIQHSPSDAEVADIKRHHTETIPSLIVSTTANRERADAAIADIKAELADINGEQAKQRELLVQVLREVKR